MTSPGNFGDGPISTANSSSGGRVLANTYGEIGINADYVSGETLTFGNVFEEASFASLGLAEGAYVWSWSGDSITMNISSVPEPASCAALFGVAMLGVAVFRRRGRETILCGV